MIFEGDFGVVLVVYFWMFWRFLVCFGMVFGAVILVAFCFAWWWGFLPFAFGVVLIGWLV